jgi:hypothetical protein
MKKILLIIFILTGEIIVNAQVVFEPLDHEVYNFLDILSQKGVIELDDIMKPLPRKYIYEKLKEAEKNNSELTDLEKQELKYYEKEYFFESKFAGDTTSYKKSPNFVGKDEAGRLRLFSYGDNNFKLDVSPILGYQLTLPGNERNTNTWNGIYGYGYFSNFLGYSMDVRVHNESGSYLDEYKYFTPEEGVIPSTRGNLKQHENSIDYSEVQGMASVDWGWGDFVFAKDYITYGYAKSGDVILSNKAPSYPYVRLDLHPVSWLKFHYFHAFLASDVIDSVNFNAGQRDIYRNKYFAWHSLVVTPTKGLDLSIGESIVYADRLEPLYMIPFMFYFLADDFLNNRPNTFKQGDANSQIFFTVSSRDQIKNTHLYGTMFIDELTLAGITGVVFSDNHTTGGLFDSPRNRTQVAGTIGASVTDLPINNLTTTIEYTRINPFVYQHHDPAQTYENANYLMGDWIGPNADLVYLDLNYRFIRGLQLDVWGQYIRKGSDSDSLQYANFQPPFLYGLDTHYQYFGINLKYEPIHEFHVTLGYTNELESDQQDDLLYIGTRTNTFIFSIYYGL